MIAEIGCYLIFGIPLVQYLGVFAFLSLMATASIGVMIHKGIRKIPFAWHLWMARLTVALAIAYLVFSYFSPC
ncbi:MAG: hypothetical protein GF370_03135 [Candidatus Nealsonbacteria bacterium]|nr:hypothetical protein [Candidatus Nealsonbacteria bacterium]